MDSTLKTRDLYGFRSSIKKIVYLSIIISFVLSVVVLFSLFLINRRLNIQAYKSAVQNANQVLQSNLSAQFAIIANDPNFITYLNAGPVTRAKYSIPLQWTFSNNFNKNLIKGIRIRDINNQEIFFKGEPTEYFTTLDLCYLGNKIDSGLGNCNYFMTVYLGKNEYLKQLHAIEHKIIPTETKYDNYNFRPFSTSFGLFHSSNFSNQSFKLQIFYKSQTFFISSLIFAITIFILCLFLSQRYLNLIIEKDLIKPVKYITDSLGNTSTLLTNDKNFLVELNNLIEVVNKYHNRLIYSKLEILTEELAHKLNNPLSGIVAIMPNILTIDPLKPELRLLERHINTIYSITSTILDDFRHSTEKYILKDDMSQPRYIIFEHFMNQLIDDFKIDKPECKYIINLNTISWIYLKPVDLQDAVVNLLRNAYESLTNEKKEIYLHITNINKYVQFDLIDTGCGIPEHEVENVLTTGKSLKHPGKGIGLNSAIEYFRDVGGDVKLISTIVNVGTHFSIKVPLNSPIWYGNNIPYTNNTYLTIISDDISLTGLWHFLT